MQPSCKRLPFAHHHSSPSSAAMDHFRPSELFTILFKWKTRSPLNKTISFLTLKPHCIFCLCMNMDFISILKATTMICAHIWIRYLFLFNANRQLFLFPYSLYMQLTFFLIYNRSIHWDVCFTLHFFGSVSFFSHWQQDSLMFHTGGEVIPFLISFLYEKLVRECHWK